MELEILKQLIKASGLLTQKKVSEVTGVPEPQITMWIKKNRKPKLSTLKLMAEKLGLRIKVKIEKL